ncbi:phage terminase, small subunit, P27 family protein [Fructilactobacillus fructivorans]|nr:phage terminase, small subunit, P27 family protein [Fructilactobacillus fructivorans]KRN40046.1 phage terminase, small subunit, P27 family protein [Fructilactobacillus fructivorans]
MRAAYDDINQNDQSRAVYHTPTNPVTGEEMETEFTGYKRNPSTQILDSATGKLQKLGNELGLTPQSRSELLSLKTDSGTKKDQREQIAKAFDSDNGSTKK